MPYIKVNPQKLSQSAQSLQQIRNEIAKSEEQFQYVSSRLDWKVSCEQDIDWILRQIDNELREEGRILADMVTFLQNAAEMYEQLEHEAYQENDISQMFEPMEIEPAPLLKCYNKLLKMCKDDVKCVSKITDNKTLGFAGDILDYFNNLFSFYNPDEDGAFGLVQFCKLAKSSSGVWKGLYSVLKEGMRDDVMKKLFEAKFGDVASGVGVAGSFAGLIGAIIQAASTGKWDDYSGIGKAGVDVGKTIYLIGEKSKVVKYSAHAYTSIIKSAMDFGGKTIEDIKKYGEDGNLTPGEIGRTGVDASIKGLNSLVSGFTFGAISLENMSTTPEELSKKLTEDAEGLGEEAGALIRNDPARKKAYDEASNIKRTQMLISAIGETSGKRIDGWVKNLVRKGK